jgi:hypothetical protein
MSDSDVPSAPRAPSIQNAFSNEVGWMNDLAHGQGTGNSVVADIHNAMDPLNQNHAPNQHGQETPEKTAAADAQVAEEQHQEHIQQITQEYHAAASGIDLTTSNEIQTALATGDATRAAQLLEQAKAGTGIYGIRSQNQKQRQLMSVYPGRAQLSPRYNLINNRG